MVIAFAITALVEWVASLQGRPFPRTAAATEAPAPSPAPVVEAVSEPELLGDGAGWAAFAEPSGPEALTVMGALSDGDVVELEVFPKVVELEEEPVEEPEPEPDPVFEEEPILIEEETDAGPRRRWAWRRKLREEPEDELEEELAPEPPKHVRILPPPEPVLTTDLDPWERGFDFDLDVEEEAEVDAAAAVDQN